MFDADELTSMRTVQQETMTESCTVRRNTLANDGAGGRTATPTTVASTVCRIGKVGRDPQEKEIAARIGNVVAHVLSLPYGTDVEAQDKIVVGSRTFEVMGVPKGTFDTAVRCVCKEIS